MFLTAVHSGGFLHVQDKNACDLGLVTVQEQIPLNKNTSEKLNKKNPFLQIKPGAFLLPFKHLNTLFT